MLESTEFKNLVYHYPHKHCDTCHSLSYTLPHCKHHQNILSFFVYAYHDKFFIIKIDIVCIIGICRIYIIGGDIICVWTIGVDHICICIIIIFCCLTLL